jgi:hypothetical protein
MRGGEAALACDAELPLQFAGVDGVEISVIAAESGKAIGYGGGGSDAGFGGELLYQRAFLPIDGVEVAVVAADVDDALDDCRRGRDFAVGVEGPLDAVELG